MEQGKAVPAPKYPKASQAADAAARAAQGGEAIARDSQFEYVQVLNEHRDEFSAAVAAKLAEFDSERGRLADALREPVRPGARRPLPGARG